MENKIKIELLNHKLEVAENIIHYDQKDKYSYYVEKIPEKKSKNLLLTIISKSEN